MKDFFLAFLIVRLFSKAGDRKYCPGYENVFIFAVFPLFKEITINFTVRIKEIIYCSRQICSAAVSKRQQH